MITHGLGSEERLGAQIVETFLPTQPAAAPAKPRGQTDNERVPLGDSAPSSGLSYRKASSIAAKPVNWLWRGRIACGKVTIVAGNPGLGKSQALLGIAATVSRGGLLPDSTACERGKAIILSAEDDAEDTIRPRLEAAGADLDNVYILDAVTDGYMPDGTASQRSFNLAVDLGKLGVMIEEIGEVSLIVIDPITAYLGQTDSHKNAEVRGLLAPLSKIAEQHGVAIICVSHLNKSGGNDALMRVTGSLAFVAAARAAYLVVKDPSNDQRRLFLPLKNNLGNDQTGLAFAIQSVKVPSAAGSIDTSCVAWEREPVTITAAEAMRAAHDSQDERSVVDDAADWLKELLVDGPVAAKKVQSEAKDAGFTVATLRRAKAAVGVKTKKDGLSGGWLWYLDAEGAHEGAQHTDMSTFEDAQTPSKVLNQNAEDSSEHLRDPNTLEVEL